MEPAAQPGDLVDGRYRVAKLIGRGSVADVFAARDEKRGDDVALKILRGQQARDREAIERLQREAQVQRMIKHRNVAAFYGGGLTARNEPYLVVELLRGSSLRQVVRKGGPVAAPHAASYAWQALQGLQAAHTLGVFHRDLKPANLMLEPSPGPVERVVLIDFGFAALEGGRRLTRAGHVVGSLGYMAPERLQGDPGGVAADLYGLGAILFELLAGRRPFVAEDELALIELQLEASPPPFEEVCPGVQVPASLQHVVYKSLAKDPVERAPDAATMARELEAAMTGA
jgi:serine/threonine-protein kinase